MPWSNNKRLSGLLIACVLLTGLMATAAPFLPGRRQVPAEVLSLTGLKQIRVDVEPHSRLLGSGGLSIVQTRRNIEKLLVDGGLTLSSKPDTPTLQVVMLTSAHPAHREVVAVTYHLSLHQSVAIERLDRIVLVPTYTLVNGELVPVDDVLQNVQNVLPSMVLQFLSRIETADRAQASENANE